MVRSVPGLLRIFACCLYLLVSDYVSITVNASCISKPLYIFEGTIGRNFSESGATESNMLYYINIRAGLPGTYGLIPVRMTCAT